MMETTRQALYSAILGAPEDDAPRLVYADYIEEHGNELDAERARLIRLQIQVAQFERQYPTEMEQIFADYTGNLRVKQQASAIYSDHWRDWFNDNFLSHLNYREHSYFEVSRGFVDVIGCPLRVVNDCPYHLLSHPLRMIHLRGKYARTDSLQRHGEAGPYFWSRKNTGWNSHFLSTQIVGGKASKTEKGKQLLDHLFAKHATRTDADAALTQWLLFRCKVALGLNEGAL